MVIAITASPRSLVTQSKFSHTFVKVQYKSVWEAVESNCCLPISNLCDCLKEDVQNLF